jgi:hypothetical protein
MTLTTQDVLWRLFSVLFLIVIAEIIGDHFNSTN